MSIIVDGSCEIPEAPPAITLTANAAKQVVIAMENEGKQPSTTFLRVGLRGGGCSGFEYVLDFVDSPNVNDFVFVEHGVGIVIDPFSSWHLEGTIIDYVETLTNHGFKFENPKAHRHCGCGSSFSM